MDKIKQKVFIVDDNENLCRSIHQLLESIGLPSQYFIDPQRFLDQITTKDRGCVLLDVRMPGLSGLEVQRILTEKRILLPVIFITQHKDVRVAVTAMKNGAMDFLLKPCSEQQLLDSIHQAMRANDETIQRRKQTEELQKRFNNLSNREKQVLSCVLEGQLNKHISVSLGISNKTVELHRSNVMKKTQARSLADLVKMTINYQYLVDANFPN